jgi:hypothetical protein
MRGRGPHVEGHLRPISARSARTSASVSVSVLVAVAVLDAAPDRRPRGATGHAQRADQAARTRTLRRLALGRPSCAGGGLAQWHWPRPRCAEQAHPSRQQSRWCRTQGSSRVRCFRILSPCMSNSLDSWSGGGSHQNPPKFPVRIRDSAALSVSSGSGSDSVSSPSPSHFRCI